MIDEHQDTDEQRAILDFAATGRGDLRVDALAGTGKTTAILKMLSVLPQRSILLCAFNKRIAETLQARLPRVRPGTAIHVKTFHALGLSILKTKYPHLAGRDTIKADSSEGLINRAHALCSGRPLSFKLRRTAVNVLRFVKEVTIAVTGLMIDLVVEIGQNNNLFADLSESEIEHVAGIVVDAFKLGRDFSKRETIDFCDMIWGPLVLDIPPSTRYQVVIVDECQDLSSPQLELLKRLVVPGGRFIGVGDFFQAIYAWRGAVPDKVFAEFERRGATVLPLTTSFRCARAVVRAAQELVPSFNFRDNAPDGSVTTIKTLELERVLATQAPGIETFVLSRSNDALLACALRLWSKRVPFQLNAGKEMLEPLYNVLDNLKTNGTVADFSASLSAWYISESKRAEAANATAWAERLEEQYQMLSVASGYTEPGKIRRLLSDMITRERTGVLLSSVHKVKGLEADRVFLLRETFKRHSRRIDKNGQPWPVTQEDLNIEYVAITRAKTSLIWVEG